jgi:hypothetical protein
MVSQKRIHAYEEDGLDVAVLVWQICHLGRPEGALCVGCHRKRSRKPCTWSFFLSRLSM